MIRFRMAKINVDQFAILTDNMPNSGLSYTVELGFRGASKAKRIGCTFTVEFAHNDKTIIKLGIFCEFDIHPDDWDARITGNTIVISKEELGYFANQTVGAARGIMYCKTEGTPFTQFIIPPVNLTKLIEDDFIVNLSDD